MQVNHDKLFFRRYTRGLYLVSLQMTSIVETKPINNIEPAK